MSRRAIPRVPPTADRDTRDFSEAVKERLEVISGLRGGKITRLQRTASAEECAVKINEILELLQLS